MGVLGYGLLAFLSAFFIHIIVWKIHVPKKNHSLVLLEIFVGVLVLSFFLKSSSSIYDFLAFALLYISLSMCYIGLYPAIEVDSPTLTMILAIVQESPDGLDKELFFSRMTNELLVLPRIRDLVNGGMVSFNDGKYRLTATGLWVVDIFIWWRKLMNAGKGG